MGLSELCRPPALEAPPVLVGEIEVGARVKGSYHGLAKQRRRHETRNLCCLVGGLSLSLATAMSTDC